MVRDIFLRAFMTFLFSADLHLSQWQTELSAFNVAQTDSLISRGDSADSCSFATFRNRRNQNKTTHCRPKNLGRDCSQLLSPRLESIF